MAFFKICTSCRREWKDREAFLADPEVELLGYQANFGNLDAGFFMFNHHAPGCETSLAIPAKAFRDLHKGPIFDVPRAAVPACPDYCMDRENLEPCPEKCECAYVRDIIQTVKNWPKRGVRQTARP